MLPRSPLTATTCALLFAGHPSFDHTTTTLFAMPPRSAVLVDRDSPVDLGSNSLPVETTEPQVPPTKGCDCQHCEEETDSVVSEEVADAQAGMEKIVVVQEPSQLNVIQEEKVQLAVWRQTSVPKFDAALQNPSITPSSLPTFADLVTPDDVYQNMTSKFQSDPKQALSEEEMDAFVGEIEELVKVFSKISQSEHVFVKLHVVEHDGCRFWHQDWVDFRLVKTYRGPCTEWVPPAFSKVTLRRRKSDSDHAQSLSHRDVALFKGRGEVSEPEELQGEEDDYEQVGEDFLQVEDGEQGHEHEHEHGDEKDNFDAPGIVHRSPRWTGECRLVLILDIPQKGWHF